MSTAPHIADTPLRHPPSTHDHDDRSMGWSGKLRIWKMVFSTALSERLVYRGDFALGTLMRFLPIVTQIFLWWAIFDSIDAAGLEQRSEQLTRENPVTEIPVTENPVTEIPVTGSPVNGNASGEPAAQIGGFGFRDMVAYYLLTMVARAFSSMPGLASGIAQQIREGEIKRYLIQPIDLIGFLLVNRIAHKVAYYAIAIAPFALVFFLCRDFFVDGFPPPHLLIAFIGSLVMGFAIGFFLEAAIGMIGFWFLEVSSLLFLYMLFSFFLSGHMFPLSLLPDNIEWFVNLLPLKYLAYFPAAVFLGKIPEDELAGEMAIQAAWLAFFIIVCRLAYSRGVARYSGYGG